MPAACSTSSTGCHAVRSVPWWICWRQETPVAATTASAPRPAPRGRAGPRPPSARCRSAPTRSRTSRPCRSSRRRARCTVDARDPLGAAPPWPPCPTSAFWWQWPWKHDRAPGEPAVLAQPQPPGVDRLDEQLLGQPDPRRRRRARSGRPGSSCDVLGAQREKAGRLAADDRRAVGSHRRASERGQRRAPSCGRRPAGPSRCSAGRSSPCSPAATP